MRYNQLKEKLLEEKQRLQKKIKGEPVPFLQGSLKESTQEFSTIDNHPSDLGAENFERAKDLSLKEHEKIRLEEVEKGLEKIQEGIYGLCSRCGSNIPLARLEADPAVAYCLPCQKEIENENLHEERPAEEKVFKTPFSGEINPWDPGYDEEDAWQEVARYGGAEGPQDVPGAKNYPPYEDNEDRGAGEKMDNNKRHRKL